MDVELKSALEAIRADLEQFRSETNASLQVVRAQLNTVEFGVLTIAQKLLAEAEVREVQARMMRKAG
ncbi:MAG TPA: hypothetical protein VFJ65_00365 [Solirubrobacterales bacterium]|nr:hypothetical protein [Solirubrobacterales bacterium]